MAPSLSDICRYPVKGLAGEHLSTVVLTADQGLPADRRFALAHGSTEIASPAVDWQPRSRFLTLLENERLAQLRVHLEADGDTLVITRGGKQVARGKPGEPMGRIMIGQFFASFMAGASRGTPKLVAADFAFSNRPEPLVTLINLASVRDLERVVRSPVEAERFRANLILDGLRPWCEQGWVGREIAIGRARFDILGPIERCAATNVNPETAARDRNIPLALKSGFGHQTMGVYARVAAGGDVATGDLVEEPA